MSQTLSLYRLQQVDNQIDRVQVRLEAIQNMLDDDAELKVAKERADSTISACQSADQALKLAESDAQDQLIKIEQIEASLYSGKGHSPKELLDLQNDVAALKRHMQTLEDLQLEAMQAVETSLSDYNVAQTELMTNQNHSVERNRGLREEKAVLLKEQEKFHSERAAIASPIPPEILVLYDQLRINRRGIAVAIISENSCSACGSVLSAAQMQSSRASGQIAYCPSCGRILYGN